ncbi:hypothetical protein INH39_03605 [Massilia violaceinigra]|uniref:Uncharacterized protein n=1 Tax=Massilia violaceinigra TaxID=2045208 RepID=A0ABY4AA38_9BURK|nr:hypothetical protein [Massilia violaceinigra]UOD30834.1 hypothetical protein INH39_03605 [Massilia violaceinigra]
MGYRRFLHMLPVWLALATSGAASAVERTETVECDLPDGSAFVLQAKHDWAMPGEVSGRSGNRDDQQDFTVDYRVRGSARLVSTGTSLAYRPLREGSNLEQLCSRLGLHQGQPGTGSSLRMPGEQRFWVPARTGKAALDAAEQQRIDILLSQSGLRLMGSHGALAMRQGKLVQELPLSAADAPGCSAQDALQCPVGAVLRLTSGDRGDTWQAASIERAPYFFKTGVAFARQAGLARPSARSLRNYRNRDDNDATPPEKP